MKEHTIKGISLVIDQIWMQLPIFREYEGWSNMLNCTMSTQSANVDGQTQLTWLGDFEDTIQFCVLHLKNYTKKE